LFPLGDIFLQEINQTTPFLTYTRDMAEKPFCDACVTIPPVSAVYTPKGTIEKLGDFDMYVTGPKDSKIAYISIYDIFGLKANVMQFADKLADTGVRVVMPDFFRGKPWEKIPLDRSELMSWIMVHGTWDIVNKDLKLVIEYLKSHGAHKFAAYGFCWGGKMSLLSTKELVSAAALIHPAPASAEDAKDVNAPVLIIPTKDDGDYLPFMEAIKKKPFGAKCYHERFDDMHHGFAAARGDWSNPQQAKRVLEAITMIANFFKENVVA